MTNNKLTDERLAHLAIGKCPTPDLCEVKAIAAELLECRKAAEPVYQWRAAFDENGWWDDCTKAQYEGFTKRQDCETRILYAAQQLSGNSEHVSQPYKLPENSFTNEDLEGMIHGNNPQSNAYRELLSLRLAAECRPESSPVIQDGWIKCSEWMPDVDLNYSAEFLCSNGYAVFTAACRCELMQDGSTHKYFNCSWADVEYWMPLPAAPQLEVGNG